MMDRTQVQYEALQHIKYRFEQAQADMCRVCERVQLQTVRLKNGGWDTDAASEFYRSIDSVVLPALERLTTALGAAAETTARIIRVYQQAEEDAAACLPCATAFEPPSVKHEPLPKQQPPVEPDEPLFLIDRNTILAGLAEGNDGYIDPRWAALTDWQLHRLLLDELQGDLGSEGGAARWAAYLELFNRLHGYNRDSSVLIGAAELLAGFTPADLPLSLRDLLSGDPWGLAGLLPVISSDAAEALFRRLLGIADDLPLLDRLRALGRLVGADAITDININRLRGILGDGALNDLLGRLDQRTLAELATNRDFFRFLPLDADEATLRMYLETWLYNGRALIRESNALNIGELSRSLDEAIAQNPSAWAFRAAQPGEALHHLVPALDSRTPEAVRLRQTFEAAGFSPNSAFNAVGLLPDLHKFMHSRDVYGALVNLLAGQSPSQMAETMDELAQRLDRISTNIDTTLSDDEIRNVVYEQIIPLINNMAGGR